MLANFLIWFARRLERAAAWRDDNLCPPECSEGHTYRPPCHLGK